MPAILPNGTALNSGDSRPWRSAAARPANATSKRKRITGEPPPIFASTPFLKMSQT